LRQVPGYSLWIGHSGDARDPLRLRAAGIQAVVDLAVNEPPCALARETTCCRFPLTDGGGNERWVIRAAISTIGTLLSDGSRTLVACSAGMSRAPAIAAAGLALFTSKAADECLRLTTADAPADVSPVLWGQVLDSLDSLRPR
jgi:protein-tyrosine phosphatase